MTGIESAAAETGEPLGVDAFEIMLQASDAALARITKRCRKNQAQRPNAQTEATRALRPERPGQQQAQAPEEQGVVSTVGAGGKKAERKIRIGNIDIAHRGQRLTRLTGLFPASPQNERDGLERNTIAGAEKLGGDEEKEQHRQPANERGCGLGAGIAGITLTYKSWVLEQAAEIGGALIGGESINRGAEKQQSAEDPDAAKVFLGEIPTRLQPAGGLEQDSH